MAVVRAEPAGGVRLLWSWNAHGSAKAVDFCPVPPLRHLLLCATYNEQPLDHAPEECRQEGMLHLLDCSRHCQLQCLKTTALLDVQWCPQRLGGRVLVAAADYSGRLLLFQLLEPQQQLASLPSRQVAGLWKKVRAVRWWAPPEGLAGGPARLAVSDESGFVTVVKLEPQGETLTQLWRASCHSHEAWTCDFSHRDGNIVYTGGEDAVLRCYDLRLAPDAPVFSNKTHELGVTSVQSDPLAENTLRTGSYDKHLYTWDPRSMGGPVKRTGMDGGVWRIRQHPRRADLLLTACMDGGSHVTDAGGATVASFHGHGGIVCGADWCRLESGAEEEGEGEGVVGQERVNRAKRAPAGDDGEYGAPADVGVAATCSSDDNLLCVWEIGA